MIINAYRFGQVVVQGKRFTNDVLITPEGVFRWWREERHTLNTADARRIISYEPEAIIVGTGTGLSQVSPRFIGAQQFLAERDIHLIIDDLTLRACQLYNQLATTQRVVAALQLTC